MIIFWLTLKDRLLDALTGGRWSEEQGSVRVCAKKTLHIPSPSASGTVCTF